MGRIIDNFIGTVKDGLVFRGRINRRDYWVFILMFLVILAVLLWFAEKISFMDAFVKLYCILMILPILAATARRLHDVDKSAKWLFAGIIPVLGWICIFVFIIGEGRESANRYGQRPQIAYYAGGAD